MDDARKHRMARREIETKIKTNMKKLSILATIIPLSLIILICLLTLHILSFVIQPITLGDRL